MNQCSVILKIDKNFNSLNVLIFMPLLLFITISCNNVAKKEQAAFSDLMECSEINYSEELYLPLKLVYNNNRLFIPDFHGDKMVSEICLKSFSRLQHFAQRGSGPVEFLGPLLLWVFENKLYVLDRQNFQIGYFSLDILDKQTSYQYMPLFSLPNSFSKLVNLDADHYLGAGYFEDGRYAIVDREGEILYYFGSYPSFAEGEEVIPYDAKAMFHQVKFSASYENRKIAALSSHVLDIIDFASSESMISNRILLSEYAYKYSSGSYVQAIIDDAAVLGSRSITSCKNYIYILNRPYTKTNINKEYQELLIYDWNGEFIRKHKVICQITNIVAVDGKEMYIIYEDLDPKLGQIKGFDLL